MEITNKAYNKKNAYFYILSRSADEAVPLYCNLLSLISFDLATA